MVGRESGRASAQLGELLVGAVPEALLALSLDGRFLLWNRAAEDAFGYRAEEVLGKNLREILVPADRGAEADEALAQAEHAGSAWLETVLRHKGGSELDVQVAMRRAGAPDVDSFIAVAVRDIAKLRDITS